MSNLFDDDEENPLADIIKHEEEKKAQEEAKKVEEVKQAAFDLKEALQPIYKLIEATNASIAENAQNNAKLHDAYISLKNALEMNGRGNIADFITAQLETHQKALARSGVPELSKSLEATKFKLDRFATWGEEDRKAIRAGYSTLTDHIDKVRELIDPLKEAIETPKEAILDSGDRTILSNVGNAVREAIGRQKWWWVGLGAALMLSLGTLIYSGVLYHKAGEAKNQARVILSDDAYFLSFWYWLEEDWGKRNPKTYEVIRKEYRELTYQERRQYEEKRNKDKGE